MLNNVKETINMSAYSIKTWLNKGFTEEEAKYQIAIRRPNNVLYYINKGLSKAEAEQAVKDRQSKGGQARKNMSAEEKRALTPRCVEFYLAKGMSIEEATIALGDFQTMFSKSKCISKHGEEEGLRIFNARQGKWQATLNAKSDEEKDEINSRKNRWINLTEEESIALKEQVGAKVRATTSQRTAEESRAIGNSIRAGMVTSGRATPEELVDEFLLYKRKVWAETNRNDLSSLLHYALRGRTGYHLDHKYSIFQGFIDNTPPEIVGHINNLEMIPYQENLSKFNKCSITLEQLLESIND